MGSKFESDNDTPISEINVTPFVDIILVVLIIFMVTTPIIMKPSINIQLPKAASGDESVPTQLNITIGESGLVQLNGKSATTEELSSQSAELLKTNPEIQAIIAADKAVPHGIVVSVIDAVKGAGVRKFAISIDKK